MATPAKFTTLRRGEEFEVKTDLGGTRTLKLCVVPGRLALDLVMKAGTEDPQTVVALAAGLPVEDLDDIATEEFGRLQEAALDLNFEACAAVAENRAQATNRMVPVLRKAGKTAIEKAMEDLLGEWEHSLKSKLPSLRSTFEQALSSEKSQAGSSKQSPSPESSSDSPKPENGQSENPS